MYQFNKNFNNNYYSNKDHCSDYLYRDGCNGSNCRYGMSCSNNNSLLYSFSTSIIRYWKEIRLLFPSIPGRNGTVNNNQDFSRSYSDATKYLRKSSFISLLLKILQWKILPVTINNSNSTSNKTTTDKDSCNMTQSVKNINNSNDDTLDLSDDLQSMTIDKDDDDILNKIVEG